MRIFRAIQGWEEQSPGNSFFFLPFLSIFSELLSKTYQTRERKGKRKHLLLKDRYWHSHKSVNIGYFLFICC